MAVPDLTTMLDPAASAARRALLRLLVTAFGDDARAARGLRVALDAAKLDALPRDADALLAFASAHLAPVVSSAGGAGIAVAVVEDLEAEITHARSSGAMRAMRLACTTPAPPSSGPAAAIGAALEIPASRVPRFAQLAPAARVRPRTALVDPEPFGRAALARTLVGGGCDVVALEDAASLAAALDAGERFDVVVAAVDRVAAAVVGSVLAARCDGALIACTRRPIEEVERELARNPVGRRAVLASSARPPELLATVRRLLAV
jgi:CheY-like chemotaxis protein